MDISTTQATDNYENENIWREAVLPRAALRNPATFAQAVAENALHDVSGPMQTLGLPVLVFLTAELRGDIAARLPGELGGMTDAARLETVLAQTAAILSRTKDSVVTDHCDPRDAMTFAQAVANKELVGWRISLPLLADTAVELRRGDGVRMDAPRSFEPYALQASLMQDTEGVYGLVLTLGEPFVRPR